MTTFTLINFFGWLVLLTAYLVKSYMTTKENKLQDELQSRVEKIQELSTEEVVQLKYEIEDLKLRRFGAFGSYGVHVQILTFGLGIFVANTIYLIF
jgi:hypothetical protein